MVLWIRPTLAWQKMKMAGGNWKMGRYDLIIMVLRRTKMVSGMSVVERLILNIPDLTMVIIL